MENSKKPLNVAEHDDLHIENKLKYITMFYRFEQLNTEPLFTQSF